MGWDEGGFSEGRKKRGERKQMTQPFLRFWCSGCVYTPKRSAWARMPKGMDSLNVLPLRLVVPN